MNQDSQTPYQSLKELTPNYEVIALWQQDTLAPLHLNQHFIERGNYKRHDRILTHITHPEMVVVPPPSANGVAVLIIPGGGYTKVAFDKEGMDTAEYLSHLGFTCYVMSYRMPGDGHVWSSNTALADAQRAMRLIRSQAAKQGIEHVAVIGFSAGGHLAGWLSTRFDLPAYPLQDTVDNYPAQPDLTALIYPVISMDERVTHLGSRKQLLGSLTDKPLHPEFSIETMVTAATPPCFILHANDDPSVPSENSILMWQALKNHHVDVDLHIVQQGGHGFGFRQTKGLTVEAWPTWLHQWLEQRLGLN